MNRLREVSEFHFLLFQKQFHFPFILRAKKNSAMHGRLAEIAWKKTAAQGIQFLRKSQNQKFRIQACHLRGEHSGYQHCQPEKHSLVLITTVLIEHFCAGSSDSFFL